MTNGSGLNLTKEKILLTSLCPKIATKLFFYSKGWLLKIVRLFGMKFSVGFTDGTSNLVKLNRVAWNLDRLLLNELSSAEWKKTADAFQQHLSDSIIQEAVQKLPAQLYKMRGDVITRKLLSRKSTIASDVLEYYDFLAKDMTIYGTDKAEHFYLTGNGDSLTVVLRGKEENSNINFKRTFYPSETKKIRLLGLDGDDIFSSDTDLQTNIEVEIDGGAGSNQYELSKGLKMKLSNSIPDAKEYLKKLRKPLRIRKDE